MPVMDATTRMEQGRDLQVEKVIQDFPNEPDQLDRIARIRGSYDPYGHANETINEYMDGALTVEEAVAKLTEPIEHCYATLDDGRALYDEEQVARHQRLHFPEDAQELWGEEQDFPEPTEEDRQKPTAEGGLWRLYFAVCHVSRKTPWTDEVKQSKLVHLVRTIKSRPDPPVPENITTAVKQNWVWSTGKLWSNLSLMGASARETWNDCPAGGWGTSTPEIHGWTNTNAFFARITIAGVAGYWNYGIWALRDVLESEPRGDMKGSQAQKIDATLPASAAWIHVAGEEAYWFICENDEDPEKRYDVNEPLPVLGWQSRKESWTKARWVFWREKFGVMALRQKLSEETRAIAAGAAKRMEEIETSLDTSSLSPQRLYGK